MTTLNYPPSPSTHVETTNTTQTVGKRKRTNSDNLELGSKPAGHNDHLLETTRRELNNFMKDLLVILRRSDTSPSILDFPITVLSVGDEEPDAKRTKLSEAQEKITVAIQVESCSYTSIDELFRDVEIATSSVIYELQARLGHNANLRQQTIFKIDQEQIPRALALKKTLSDLILRETLRRPDLFRNSQNGNHGAHDNRVERAIMSESGYSDNAGQTVLTLFGNTQYQQHARQLFTSLQMPTAVFPGKTSKPRNPINAKSSLPHQDFVNVFPPLREATLPNGITTSKIVPVHSTEPGDGREPKFIDFYRSPFKRTLDPPVTSKHSRSSSVNWYHPNEATKPPPHVRATYPNQMVSSGQWLTYNIAPSPDQLSSPEAKRKQRDRALSIGEARPALPQEIVLAHQKAKEDALFRSSYSSFAPSKDNTGAIISEDVKNRLWWKKIGERRFGNLSALNHIQEQHESALEHDNSLEIDDETIFKQAVENWVPDEAPPELQDTNTAEDVAKEKDVKEILQDISELLETLNSYQRIRNLTLASNARTSAGQNPQLSTISGSPSSPSPAEFSVYEILKSQLSILISTLPPYAVAKLNGDHLEALNVSTKLPIEGKNFTGIMEEDDFTLKARQAASAATRTATAASNVRSGQYPQALNTPKTGYVSQVGGTRSTALPVPYHQHQQYPTRESASTNQHGSNGILYNAPRRSSAVKSDRNSYSNQSYGQQTPLTQPSQYSANGRPVTYQNGHAPPSPYRQQERTSATPVQAQQYQRPSQPGYQQRAMNSTSYNYHAPTNGGTQSPQGLPSYIPQPRPSQSSHSQSPAQEQPPFSPPATSSSTVQVDNAAAAANNNRLTANEQALLMNHQKQPLGQQVVIRQGSSTPQPPNTQSEDQRNGTPVAQQNGIVAGR